MTSDSASATTLHADPLALEAGEREAAQPRAKKAKPEVATGRWIPAAPWLDHLREHLPLARAGSDPEGVHQVRIAAGRLDVWLRLGETRVLRDDLRWLRHGVAGVRDLDVLLERSQPAPFAHALEQARRAEREQLERVTASPRLEALLEALSLLAPLRRKLARKGLEREAAKLLRRGRKALASRAPEDVHALRRSLRRLRYGREWLGLGARSLERLQDELGKMADAATLLRYLERCPPWESSAELRATARFQLDRTRERGLERYLELAPRLRAEP